MCMGVIALKNHHEIKSTNQVVYIIVQVGMAEWLAVCLMIFLLITILLVLHLYIPAYPYNMVGLSGDYELKGNKPDHNRFHVDLKHPNWPNDYTFGQLMPIGQSRPPKKNMNNVGSVIVCNQLAQNAIMAGLDNSTRQYIPSLLNIH